MKAETYGTLLHQVSSCTKQNCMNGGGLKSGACDAPRTWRKCHEVSFYQKTLKVALTWEPAVLLSNLVSEIVIVTEFSAEMAPPYKLGVCGAPPHTGNVTRFLSLQKSSSPPLRRQPGSGEKSMLVLCTSQQSFACNLLLGADEPVDHLKVPPHGHLSAAAVPARQSLMSRSPATTQALGSAPPLKEPPPCEAEPWQAAATPGSQMVRGGGHQRVVHSSRKPQPPSQP